MRDFIPSLDKANERIRKLEAEIGMPTSASCEQIEEANDRVQLLESYKCALQQEGQQPAQVQSESSLAAQSLDKAPAIIYGELFGLQRAIVANKRKQKR